MTRPAPVDLAERVRKIVDAAPELTDEQRAKIAGLLAPAPPRSAVERSSAAA
jgi:hypothetical protein